MKTQTKLIRSILALCSSLAVFSALGQATFVWTNSSPADLGAASSWTNQATGANGVPTATGNGGGVQGDTMLFNGASTGAVLASSDGGAHVGSSVGGTIAGIWMQVGANQTSPVTIHTTVANSASQGLRFNNINIEAGAGSFSLGKNSTTNCLDTLWGTSNPSSQGLTNNSANPAYIHPDVRWRLGAGGAHTMVFSGTGDWIVTNDIANVNGAASLVQKDGAGTMYWTAGRNAYWGTVTTISTPLTISGGSLVLKSGGLFPPTTTINNAGTLVLDAPAGSQAGGAQTIANPVNGAGSLRVNTGTLTLSGANTYTGNTTLNGGSLVANRAENLGVNGPLGVGGLITFTGGTLVFSSVNAYDYSPRFATSAGQSFRFDTAGQNVTFTNAIASTGGTLTKLGSGSLTLSGVNTYDGATTVSAGKLVIQGAQGSGAITVANNAALGVTGGGVQTTPATLTIGTGVVLEFNSISSTVTAPLAVAGAISAAGPVTVNVNSGSFLIGSSYPLFSWGSGSAPAVTLGTLVGAVGNLSTNGTTIQLNITGLAYVWRGNTDGKWDTTTANNWLQNGSPALWANGSAALLDDTVTGETNVVLNAPITTASVTVNANAKTYSITASGANVIGGSGSLTKNGSSVLTLAGGVNTYSGVSTINGGTLSVGVLADGGAASDIGAAGSGAGSLVLNGGTLQYTGAGATINRLFTLGTAGGTIDNQGGGALVLNNTGAIGLSGSGARTLTLTGTGTDELAAALADSGGATALIKSGPGLWTVSGNNPISGTVTVNGGTLQVGTGGATGSVGSGPVAINPAGSILSYNRTGTVTNGTISGVGALAVNGGVKVVLPNNNTYSGGTTIDSASTLQVGVGGATGQLSPNANITVDGTLDFNTSGTFAYGGTGITGGGNVIVRGGGKITSLGANSYTGWTLIGAGSTFQPCQGNQGALASSIVTNNGTLLLIRQDNAVFIYAGPITGTGSVLVDANNFNAGDVTLTGDCNYTGGTFIGDNGLIIGDGGNAGWITGNVTFQNSTQVPNDNPRTLTFNRADDLVFPGNIVTNFTSAQNNRGVVVKNGAGKLTLTGNNSYDSGTTVNAGTLLINGNNSGTGTVTVNAGATLGGTGTIAGSVNVAVGGILAPGASLGTLTINSNLTLAGDLAIEVNKAGVPTSDKTTVGGTINNTGVGTVTVANLGPALAIGDKFTLFNKPVANGAALSIVGGGVPGWKNDLAVDGSITVAGPTLNMTQTGNVLNFSWDGSYKLQAQTNTLSVGLSNNWGDYPGGGTSPVSVTMDPSKGTVFFRLATP